MRHTIPDFARAVIAAIALIAITGCRIDDSIGPNPYTGCYDNSCVAEPRLVDGIPALQTVSALAGHVCGLTADGEAWCWGDNSLGQLGDGTFAPRSTPVKVATDVRFATISVGNLFTCALSLERTVYCWGIGVSGQLGQPSPDACGLNVSGCSMLPLALPGSFVAVDAGTGHACALDADGAASCWGFNMLGEVGSTKFGETVPTPFLVPGGHAFVSIAAGDMYTCALKADGRAFCWGSGNRNELGRSVGSCGSVFGFVNYCSPVPVSVATSATFVTLAVGNSHACGLTSDGTAHCWGDNGQGQLGTGDYASPVAPVVAQGGMRFDVIDASGAVTCGTPVTGVSVCWGLNLYGKLGIGSRLELSPRPMAIVGDRRYRVLAGSQTHVCGITTDGATYCWGSGSQGQLGHGPMLP